MTEYIIDMLGDIDDKLLEEALDLPQQAEEVVIEVDKRRDRNAFFVAISAIAAGLAIIVSVVILRASLRHSDITASDSDPSAIAVSENSYSGILIPTEFTADDYALQQILNIIDYDAEEVSKHFFDGDIDAFKCVGVVFPQFNRSITMQLDKYAYAPCRDIGISIEERRKRLSESFTAEAVDEYMKLAAIAEKIEDFPYEDNLAVNIVEGGIFDEEGHLVELPNIFELGDVVYERHIYGKSEQTFLGYWSTAKVVSKTDDEIIFTYIRDVYGELVQETGRLVDEDGWKLSWCGNWIL